MLATRSLAACLSASVLACSSGDPTETAPRPSATPQPTATATAPGPASSTPPTSHPGSQPAPVPHPVPSRSFTIFNITPCYDELGMEAYGIVSMPYATQSNFFASGADVSGPPDLAKVATLAGKHEGTRVPMMLDIESWPTSGTDDDVAETVARYESVLDAMLGVDPGLTLGFYGVPPIRNYNAPVSGDPAKIAAWHAKDDKLQSLATAEAVVFPSLYTFYDKPDDWVAYAKGNIDEARRLAPDKPVHVVLWPRYHDDTEAFIQESFFALQLDTAYELADGVVIWDYAASTCAEEAWWTATKSFAKSHDLSE